MEAHLLNSILQLGAGQSEVLQGANDGAVRRRVRRRYPIRGGELGLRVDGGGRGFAVKHTSAVKELVGVLALMKEEAIGTEDDLDAEEVMQRPQVLQGELGAETISELS
jgi:hypothetical protein